MKGFYIPERESVFDRVANASSPDERRKQLLLAGMVKRKHELRQGEYMETLVAGLADLGDVMKPGESVVTLDMVNPFEFMMQTRPAEGSYLTLHKDRTISAKAHPAPEAMFADADRVMIAKMSLVQATADLMAETYAGWLDANYDAKIETSYWTRWSRKKPGRVLGLR